MKQLFTLTLSLLLSCSFTLLKAQTVEFNYDLTSAIAAGGTSVDSTGNAGVVFFNNQFWVSRWSTDQIHLIDNAGNYISTFQVPGVSSTRSMTTDGTHIYCGTASTSIFKVDPTTKTLVSTIAITTTTTATSRLCAYDASLNGGLGGFWLANFGTDIISVDMNGNQLSAIPAATHGFTGMYGGAVDGLGNLYIYTQEGPNTDQISVLNLTADTIVGTPYNVFTNVSSTYCTSSLAGGFSFSDDVVPGKKIAVGLSQGTPGNVLFGIDFNIVSGNSAIAAESTFGFALLPNVTSDMTSLSFKAAYEMDANLSVYGLDGKLVYQQALGQVQDAQRIDLNTTEFAAGVYQVIVQTNETQYSQKLVVVK